MEYVCICISITFKTFIIFAITFFLFYLPAYCRFFSRARDSQETRMCVHVI